MNFYAHLRTLNSKWKIVQTSDPGCDHFKYISRIKVKLTKQLPNWEAHCLSTGKKVYLVLNALAYVLKQIIIILT